MSQDDDELEASAEVVNGIFQATQDFRAQPIAGNANYKKIIRPFVEDAAVSPKSDQVLPSTAASSAHGNTVAIRCVIRKRTFTVDSESPLNANRGLSAATKPAQTA